MSLPSPVFDLGYSKLLQDKTLVLPVLPSDQTKKRRMLAKLGKVYPNKSDIIDNDIHPLFHPSRWPFVDKDDYKLLAPSLRIASLMIQQSSVLKWFEHTMLAPLRGNDDEGWVLDPTFDSARLPLARQMTKSVFNRIFPRTIWFDYHDLDYDGDAADGMAFISTHTYMRYKARRPNQGIGLGTPWVVLRSRYKWILRYLRDNGTQAQIENVQLRVAITICHELAHVMWMFRCTGISPFRRGNDVPDEPFHCANDRKKELGFSLEKYLFGGDIWGIENPDHFVAYYKSKKIVLQTEIVETMVVIPHWWIHIWFRKSTWRHFGMLFGTGQLKLPDETESGIHFQENPSHPGIWSLCKNGFARYFCMPFERPPCHIPVVYPPLPEINQSMSRAASG